MKIQRTSPLSGVFRSREFPTVTQERLDRWLKGDLIQRVFPELSPDDREFIMTGVTPEEWESTFGKE